MHEDREKKAQMLICRLESARRWKPAVKSEYRVSEPGGKKIGKRAYKNDQKWKIRLRAAGIGWKQNVLGILGLTSWAGRNLISEWAGRWETQWSRQSTLHSHVTLWFWMFYNLPAHALFSLFWVGTLGFIATIVVWRTQNYSSIWKSFLHDPETWYNATSWAWIIQTHAVARATQVLWFTSNQPQFRGFESWLGIKDRC